MYGCNNDKNLKFRFQEMDFTYSAGMGGLYSIKIDSTGNFFLGEGRPPKRIYFGVLSDKEKFKLDSIYNVISFNKFNTLYNDSLPDLSSYSIVITSKGKAESFTVYGSNKEPEKLKAFSEHMVYLIHHVNLIPIDTVIIFKSLNKIYQVPEQGRYNERNNKNIPKY